MNLIEFLVPVLSILAIIIFIPLAIRELKESSDRFGAVVCSSSIVVLLFMNVSFLRNRQWIIFVLAALTFAALVVRVTLKNNNSGQAQRGNNSNVMVVPFLSLWLFLVNLVQNQNLPIDDLLLRILPGVYLLVYGLCMLKRLINWKIPFIAFILGTLLVNASAVFVDSPWRACDQFKCGPFGALYTGSYSTENTLALFCGLALVGALAMLPGVQRVAVGGALILAIYATESRTSQLAAVVGIFTLISIRVFSRSAKFRRSTSFIRTLTHGVLISLFVGGLYIVSRATPSDFSNRGNTWIQGLSALGLDWPFGLGIDRWVTYQQIGVVPPLFPHSQYLLVLFGGGIIGIVLLFGTLSGPIKSRMADHLQLSTTSAVIVYLAVIGLTEVFWNPLALDSGTVIAVLVISLVASSSRNRLLVAGIDRAVRQEPIKPHINEPKQLK